MKNKILFSIGIIILISAIISYIKIPAIIGSAASIWFLLGLIGIILIISSFSKNKSSKPKK